MAYTDYAETGTKCVLCGKKCLTKVKKSMALQFVQTGVLKSTSNGREIWDE